MEFIKQALTTFFSLQDYSSALKLAYVIANSEENPDKKLINKLDFIQKNTTENLKINFFLVWNIVSLTRSPNKTIEIRTNKGYKEFSVGDLIIEIQNAHKNMCLLMGSIAHKYDLSIPVNIPTGKGEFKLPVIK